MEKEELTKKVYSLANGIRDVPDICTMIFGEGHGPDTKTKEWFLICEIVDSLIEAGDIYMKDTGVLLDLWR